MKKLFIMVLFALLLFVISANAQQYPYYFTLTAWTETADTLSGTTNYLPSSSGFAMFQNGRNWSNIFFTIDATTLSDSIDVVTQYSTDGTNFFDYVAERADVNSSSTDYNIDITDHYFPYVRFKISNTAADVLKYNWFLYGVNK